MSGGTRSEALRRQLSDSRSGQVVFVSHCLLNENVRYLGGACTPGMVGTLVDEWRARGYGICQMPCPEQRAWGGVLKPQIATAFGVRHSVLWWLRRPILRAFTWYTKFRYRLLARQVAADVRDYQRSGFTVAGVVGVAGSPSCGITKTLDVGRWLDVVSRYRPDRVSREELNREAVIANVVPGEGWFMRALLSRLGRLDRPVDRFEHDLIRELGSRPG